MAAGRNVELFAQQIRQFRPEIVALCDEDKLPELKSAIADLDRPPIVLAGNAGVVEVARYGDAEAVVTGIVGCAGLLPTIAAIKAGKDIALANKETLIAGGPVVLPLVEKHGVKLLPADSEHSAIFQCLQGVPKDGLRKILLTASGGAFRDWAVEKLADVTVAEALAHPTWKMGPKITIDSSTLMNKGLEVIEAHHLFGIDYDRIDVVVHPQSIVHSLITLVDGAALAHMGNPDMRAPIAYALHHPERVAVPIAPLDLAAIGTLTFEAVDEKAFPCLRLAREVGRAGGTAPCVLNAANEVAVHAFLTGRLGFPGIPEVIAGTLDELPGEPIRAFETLYAADREAREVAADLILERE